MIHSGGDYDYDYISRFSRISWTTYSLSVFVGIKFRGFRAFLAIRENKFLREFVPAKIKPLKVVLFVLVLKMDSVDMMSTRPEGDTLCHQNYYSNAFLADETSSLHAHNYVLQVLVSMTNHLLAVWDQSFPMLARLRIINLDSIFNKDVWFVKILLHLFLYTCRWLME